MDCPKCAGEMETISSDASDALKIDRCKECSGLYFDQLTQQDLKVAESQVAVDIGDAELGAEYDDMVYVECPKCDRIMDQRKTESPVRIRFELCTSCYSTFLDAGEFRQYLSNDYREEFEALLPDA